MNYNPQMVNAEFFEQEYDFDTDDPYEYAEREILGGNHGERNIDGLRAKKIEENEESKNKILKFCRFYGLKGRRLIDNGEGNKINEEGEIL